MSDETDGFKLVPVDLYRAALYFHSLTEIWEYYRALGNEVPPEVKGEMKRLAEQIVGEIKDQSGQGGHMHNYYKKELK